MKRRRFLSRTAAGAAIGLASGCVRWPSRGSTDPEGRDVLPSFKVGMVLPGPVDDSSWSQSGYEGLQRVADELGTETAYIASTDGEDPASVAEAFRQLVADGCTFSIGLGSQYIPQMEMVADEFPRQQFAVFGTYAGNGRNFGTLGFRYGELGYLAGIVAGLVSETGCLGLVGGEPVAAINEEIELMRQAFDERIPGGRVVPYWADSWNDADRARVLADRAIAEGADVLVAIANAGDRGTFEAAEAAGIRTIGWVEDKYDWSPKTVLTSAVQDVPELIFQGAALARSGRWAGRQYRFGIHDDVQRMAPLRGSLSSQQEAVFIDAERALLSGTILRFPEDDDVQG